MRYTFTIPSVPPSLNEWKRMSMFPAARAQKAWQAEAWAVLNEKGNRAPRGCSHITLRSVLTFAHNRRHDPTNYGSVLYKWLTDVLVREGVIPDDTQEYVACIEPVIIVGTSEHTFLTMEYCKSCPGEVVSLQVEEPPRACDSGGVATPSKRGVHV